jgi:hypothetical protein
VEHGRIPRKANDLGFASVPIDFLAGAIGNGNMIWNGYYLARLGEAASLLGKRSYQARLRRFGIERVREIARENGKLGGRPPKRKDG